MVAWRNQQAFATWEANSTWAEEIPSKRISALRQELRTAVVEDMSSWEVRRLLNLIPPFTSLLQGLKDDNTVKKIWNGSPASSLSREPQSAPRRSRTLRLRLIPITHKEWKPDWKRRTIMIPLI